MNERFNLDGLVSDGITIERKKLEIMISNDYRGKTISINNGEIMFTIPFEPLEKYLK